MGKDFCRAHRAKEIDREEKMTNPDIRLAADLHTLALPSEK